MNTFYVEYRRNEWCVTEYAGITSIVVKIHSVANQAAADLLRGALVREARVAA